MYHKPFLFRSFFYSYPQQTVHFVLSQYGSKVVIPLFIFIISLVNLENNTFQVVGMDGTFTRSFHCCSLRRFLLDFLWTRWPMYNAFSVLANFKLNLKLGYLKESNAVADSVDSDIFYVVINLSARSKSYITTFIS